MLNTTNDIAELVERVRKKDTLAMKLLYNHFSKEMLTLSFRITQNMQDSEDILQESFLKSFQQIHKLRVSKTYPAWLKRIVVNESITTTRKQGRFGKTELVKDDIEDVEEEENWYEKVSFSKIKTAIDQLPDRCRAVLTLYLIEGYKHKEIAEIMNISISTSKSQYSYSLKLMKKMLKSLRNDTI